ncbi:MAG: transglycosylase domain-containing protein [Bdellovibrionales bacterium]|nr:transglycosylase domain-containing protein [Bdellovibrionales bacterium]
MSTKKIVAVLLALAFVGVAAGAIVLITFSTNLPKLITVEDYEPLLVSEVYDRGGNKIGEFFREKRMLVPYKDTPPQLIQAFTSAEDSSFFQHGGINYIATIRALIANIRAGRKVQGGSTITMQVARSLLLSREKTYTRKIKEVMLSYRMEKNLSKQDILYLYLNQIYLGQGAYGIGAAADIYFRKPVNELTLPEMALLAGLPQAPSRYSPIYNPSAAKERQLYVLGRMAEDGYVTTEEAKRAGEEPLQVYVRKDYKELAPFYLETVRQMVIKKLGEIMVLDKGIKIYTGLDLQKQVEAQNQVRNGLRSVDKRQGFRGPKESLQNPEDVAKFLRKSRDELMDEASAVRIIQADGTIQEKGELDLDGQDDQGNPLPTIPPYLSVDQIVPAVVMKVDDTWGLVHVRFCESKGLIDFESMKWARQPDPGVRFDQGEISKPSEALKAGDVIEVRLIGRTFSSQAVEDHLNTLKKKAGKNWKEPEDLPDFKLHAHVELEQEPSVEGALVAIDQNSEDVLALVGGYDFTRSEFNRALQAARQTGSAFKSLVYAAALDKGYTPATSILDSPIVYEEEDTEVQDVDADEIITKKWKPLNHSKRFMGETLFRKALIRSLNVPTVKIIEKIGVDWVANYARRLGVFSPLNYDFTMALGSSGVTLYEMTKMFSIFGRMGKKVTPRLIHKVEDQTGKILLEEVTLDDRFEAELAMQNKEFEMRREAYLRFKKSRQPTKDETSADTEDRGNDPEKDPQEVTTTNKDINVAQPGADYMLKLEEFGKVIDLRKEPPLYFEDPGQLMDTQTAYIATSLLQGVVEEEGGTGRAARAVGRPVAGKTGSTSGYYDAWFIGYSPDISTGVWVGYDEEKSLGKGEVGGRAALPVWIEFMKFAHEGLPVRNFSVPDGIVFANIDNETGKLASASSTDVVRQAFKEGTEPGEAGTENTSQEEKNFFKEDLSE